MMNAVLIILGALLASAVLAEFAARMWIRRFGGYYVLPPGVRMRLRPDPDTFPSMEKFVRFDVNADGERAGAVPRAEGLYRILVAGGSQPEGYLLDQSTFWPGRLQTLLRTREYQARLSASSVHVGSIARSGVGSEALDLIFRRVLGRYPRLQLIIILVGASDVLRWLEAGAPTTPPPPVQVDDTFRCHPEVAFGLKPSRLAIVEVLRRLRHRWLRPIQFQDRACKWIGRARTMRANAKEMRTTVPDPSPMLRHFDTHFRHAIEKAKAHADRVLVIRQPWFDKPCAPNEAAQMWHGAIGQAWREQVTTFFSHEVLRRLMAALDARAAEIAAELNVEQLDMRPHLEPSVDNYYDFFHVTPLGASTFANVVANSVLREPLEDQRPYEPDLNRKVS